jgi:hypothetical protein
MPILHLVFAATLALSVPQDCADWQSCRDQATAARSREDYERFHDLAWRAVQKGPKNDPALMLMLARAQSLSGRPGDALVMLERLARMGVATDAATSPDLRRVRALAGWADLEQRLAGTAPAPEPTAATTGLAEPKPAARPAPPAEAPPAPPAAAPAPASPAAILEPSEALRFSSPGITPDGLAYDGVSRRFLVADRTARKLTVVDEFSRHVATLAGAQAAFGDIEALEIDPRAGDLWVVSSEPDAAGGATTLHKLQLVSGRVLATFTAPPVLAPARFVDVAVANGGTILVLDANGRLLRLRGSTFELAAVVPPGATSLAPTDNGTLYVSTADGIVRIELATRAVLPVMPPESDGLSGITRLRWHRGSLVGIQKSPSGSRLVRLRVGRAGGAVVAVEPIDSIDATAGAFTISGSTLYYFASKGGGEVVLKKLQL